MTLVKVCVQKEYQKTFGFNQAILEIIDNLFYHH